MDSMSELKLILREESMPYFTDDELEYYLGANQGSVRDAAYECLLVKSESTNMNLPGLTLADTSAYFRRLSIRYRRNNSGVLGG